jgi:hypothetical protein
MARVSAPDAMTSAIAGIRGAQMRLDSAAASVVREGTRLGKDTVSISAEARASAGAQGSQTANEGDLPGAMVELLEARHGMKLNVAMLRTADEVTETLLDVVKHR